MTEQSALDLLAEVRRLGGHLRPKDGGRLGVVLPAAEQPRLLPAIRERKHDLLMLLARPEGACPAGHPPGHWQDAVGQWHCLECEPKPAWFYLRGVSLEVMGNRQITLEPPTGDLGRPGSWARTHSGAVVELVLYCADGREVLVRHIRAGRLEWFAPEQLLWEWDWGWRP